MANTTTIKFVGQFDSSGITKGLQEIKKQMSNTHIGEDLRKQLETALNKVEANIPALEKMSAKGEFNEKELIAYQKLIQEVSKDMANLNKVASEADFTKNFSAADNAKLEQFKKQLADIENKLKTTRKEILDNFSKTKEGQINGKNNATLNGFIERLISVPPDQIENKLEEIVKDVESQAENTVQKLKQDFATKANKNKIHKEDFINLIFGENSGVTFKEGKVLDNNKDNTKIGARTVYNQIREEILALKEDANSADIEEILNKYHAFIEEYFNVPEGKQSVLANIITPEIIEHLKNLSEHIPELKQALGEEGLKLLAEGEAEKVRITAEQTAFMKQTLDELVATGKITKEQAEAVAKALGLLNEQAEKGKNQIGAEKAQADALSATFGSLAHRIESAVSAMAIFNKSVQIMRQAIRSVEELDAAFTQIAIVSEQSNESAWKMFDSFNKLAKQYSITTKDLTEGAKLFYQQGLSAADTMKMVEASTVSAALGEVTMTEAANTLTAAIQGYNESAAVAMDYTDKIAMVGAVSAADFNELSAAMEKTASSAYTAGIDFDHLLGYLGKMIEVTREAPANLGTAMKTIIARFEDMKKDPAKALEDGISFNKVEEALRTLGISMRDTAGEFRPLQEVFTELGMQWESLTRNQQAYIATVAAGSRQQSRFLAMMNNFDRTLELIAEAQNSAGAAARQYATYQDSIAAAQARLTASWEKFYSKIVDNDAIKFAINGLASLVEALSKVPPAITAIGTAFGALSLQSLLQSKGGLIKIIGSLLGATDDSKQYEIYGLNAIQKFITGFQKGLNNSGIDDALKEKLGPAISEGTAEAVKGLGNLAQGAKSTGSAFDILKGKIIGAGTALKSLMANPVLLAIGAAIAIVAALGYAIYKASQKANDAAKEVKKLNKEIDELNSKSKNQKDLINSYEELTRKAKRSEEEQKQLNSVIDQISETYKNANVYIDEYGNRHLTNVEALKQENKQLDDNIKKLKLEALAAQEAFLATNSSQWTQENTTDAGLSSDFYSKWNTAVGSGAADAALQSIETQLREQLPNTIKDGITEKTINTLEDIFSQYAPDFDIDNSKIKESISELTDLEEIINAVRKAYVDAYKASENFGQAQLVIDQELQRINIDRWALNFEVDPKQSGLKAAFIDMLRALPVEQFKLVGDNLKQSFEESLQQLSEPKEILKAQNFITDAVKGSFEANKIFDEARKAGVNLSGEFLNSMQLTLREREKQLKENVVAAVNNIFGGIDVSNNPIFDQEGITQKQAERIVSHAEFIKNNSKLNNIANNSFLRRLSPEMEEIDKLIENAIKNGTTDGLNEGIEEFKQKVSQENGLIPTEIFYNYTEQQLQGVVDQIILGLENSLTEAKETLANYKEFLNLDVGESLSNDQYSELQSIFGNLTSQYIEINKEGKEYLTIAGKTALLEKQKEKTLEIIDKLYKANNEKIEEIHKNEKLTNDQKANQIQKLNRQNELLEKQKRTVEDIDNLSKSTAAQTNISLADKYYKDLEVIKQAQKEAQVMNGRINRETYNSLLSIDSAYVNYVNKRITGEGAIYEATAENLKNIEDLRTSSYQHEVDLEKESLQRKIDSLDSEIAYFESIVNDEAYFQTKTTQEANRKEYESNVQKLNDILNDEEEASNDTLENQQNEYNQALTGQSKFADEYLKQVFEMYDQAGAKHNDYIDAVESGSHYYSDSHIIKPIKPKPIVVEPVVKIKNVEEEEEKPAEGEDDFTQEWARKYLERAKKARDRLQAQLNQLDVLAPDFEIPTGSGKEFEDELEKITKTVEDLANALEDLDKLLKDIRKDLKDISADYNPFLEIFEEWEHEWDYYYNIKNLIDEISKKRTFLDNIVSGDYASAEEKSRAREAQIGNTLAGMAANDTYITSLRAGLSQRANNIMENYGKYYKIDPDSLMIYQTDKNLNSIKELINLRKQEEYELKKINNVQENDLNLTEAKKEALEIEKGAYEDIDSTLENVNETLTDYYKEWTDQDGNFHVETRVTNLLKGSAADQVDEAIDTINEEIKSRQDRIQEIEVQLDLKGWEIDKLEEYVDDMEDAASSYLEMRNTLFDTIAQQQEFVQQLAEARQYYIDTAIDMQQKLYDAIVENYQKEINEKKKQYDYLKQLDQDYLRSIRDNISKERQIREDANKQKSYQQNIQRAQLLQMDTSGSFRSELAALNKEIETQRQDLYDDLVDKQVQALEKEIDKRHELYDKEVAALEERLNYMQENAILLWEMVNDIVSRGSEAMMATLENTSEYINSNDLQRMEMRNAWEQEALDTYKAVEGGFITTMNTMVAMADDFANTKYPEIQQAIDEYAEVFDETKGIIEAYNAAMSEYSKAIGEGKTELDAYNAAMQRAGEILGTSAEEAAEKLGLGIDDIKEAFQEGIGDIFSKNSDLFDKGSTVFQGILDDFMETWNDKTYKLTGYSENWKDTIDYLQQETAEHIDELRGYYDEEGWAREEMIGSIEEYNEQLQSTTNEMYQDFIDERDRYRNELEGIIADIQARISDAIGNAAQAIQDAANNIQFNSPQPTYEPSGSAESTYTPTPTKPDTGIPTEEPKYHGYEAIAANTYGGPTYRISGSGGYSNGGTRSQLEKAFQDYVKMKRRQYPEFNYSNFKVYKQGGFADFTGPAWLDGTKSQPEAILNAKQTRLFTSMVSSLEKASNNSNINSALGSSYNIGDINTNINVEKLDNETDIDRVAKQVENRIMKSIRNRVSIAVA